MNIEHNLNKFEISEQDCLLVQGGNYSPSTELFLLLSLNKEQSSNEVEKPTSGMPVDI